MSPERPGRNRTPSPSAALPWPRPPRLRFGVRRELMTRKHTGMVPPRGQNNGHNQQLVLLWHWGAAQRVNSFYFDEHPHPTIRQFGNLTRNLTARRTSQQTSQQISQNFLTTQPVLQETLQESHRKNLSGCSPVIPRI